ncbi:MAG: DUF362 domain-containing protein [Acidobacteria bacterium]|nr:DUF362 domain-containing protein [Acidobacteriota bacterium]
MTKKSKVAVLYTKPETVLEDYERLFKLAEVEKHLDRKKTTILKDNISWHYPFPGANTTPWQMEGSIRALEKFGYKDITCVQNKTVVINTFKGEDRNLYVPIFEKYKIPVLYNFKDEDMKWIKFEPKAKMLVLDKIFPEGIMIPDYFFDKNILHLPTVKCHIYTTTTGAMKNAFGGLLSTYRHYTHSWIHQTLVDLLKIQKEIHTGLFAVMDGTTAGNGPGPRTMKPEIKNIILASNDQVAIDAVAAKLMGFDPMKIDYIRLATEEGLGNGKPEDIEIVGDNIEGVNWHFRVGWNFHRWLGWMAWYGPTRVLQKIVLRTPMVAVPIMISEVNHDYVHWPLKGQFIFKNWRNKTEWGALFRKYESEGTLKKQV